MSKLIISGKIGGESLEFCQGILTDLEGHAWVKKAIRAGLRQNPTEAHDGGLLIFEAMRLRLAEVEGENFDDES